MVRFHCTGCGAELPGWFDPAERLYDVDEDDAAYERWLDAPCPRCGKSPRELGGAGQGRTVRSGGTRG